VNALRRATRAPEILAGCFRSPGEEMVAARLRSIGRGLSGTRKHHRASFARKMFDTSTTFRRAARGRRSLAHRRIHALIPGRSRTAPAVRPQYAPKGLFRDVRASNRGLNMSRCHTIRFAVIALLTQAIVSFGSAASAQSASDVVGTWTLVSSVTEKDGTKTDQFGSGAKGMLTMDADGHFMLTIIGPDLPRFVSNNRAAGTPEENKAVMSKSIAMIGTYSVNPGDRTLTFKVDSSTFPNWNGTEQKRLLASGSKDELKYVTPSTSSGGVGTVTWRRAR
jgi:hypothetical protein